MTITLKKSNIIVASLAIATAVFFSCPLAFADQIKDSIITAEVKALLISEKDIPSDSISVSTKDRIVILQGTVDTVLQAHQAVEVASSVSEVIDVVDTQLKVKNSKSLIADALITAKVKGKIRYLFVNRKIAHGYELHVETTDQIVHILGAVARQADLDTVVAAAKEVKGVKSVKTNIKLL
jgi:hyperosmotically inducible protein